MAHALYMLIVSRGFMKIISSIFLMLTMILTVATASAKVDIQKTKRLYMPDKKEDVLISEAFTLKVQPKQIAPDESSKKVLSKMVDNSLSYYWENSQLRYSPVGKTAEAVEKKVNLEANYKDENNIEHKVSFKVLAMQALAKIEYKGWVNAFLNYDMKSARAEAALVEALSSKNDLVLSHAVTHSEQKSELSLRWKW